ncbi:delta-60 repeat domain-containing protein [Pseudomonas sp. H2_D02]
MNHSYIDTGSAARAGTGKSFVDLDGYNNTAGIAVAPDGKIWLAGMTGVNNPDQEYEGYRASLIRLNADGTLDTSFSDDGKTLLARDVYPGEGYSATVQPDGKFLMVYPQTPSSTVAMVRLNLDGSVDQSFGVNGTASAPAAWGDFSRARLCNRMGRSSFPITTPTRGCFRSIDSTPMARSTRVSMAAIQ